MNSNNLRIRSSDIKTRNNTCFDPVLISDSYKIILNENEIFKGFLEAKSEKQISILKQILYGIKDNCNHDTVNFLVIVYLESDIKHPAKCMVSRYVTKNDFIQKEFTELLTKEVDSLINKPCTDYNSYVHVITKVTSCIENFPAGAATVQNLEIELAEYFKNCLYWCISTLSNDKPLAPTEKNEIFTLVHSTLRLLLHITQKIREDNTSNLIALFGDIRISLKYLICDVDAPMDTKSICGLLYVSMHVLENNSDSWIDILESGHNDEIFKDIFSDESAKLCIYSALVTVIPTNKLKVELPTGEPAIIKITKKILEIGDRCAGDAAVSLGVCRALAAAGGVAGAAQAALLLPWLCGALEGGADAVQHAAALALRHLVCRADLLRRRGDEEAMDRLVAGLAALDPARKSFYVGVGALGAELGAARALLRLPRLPARLLAALRLQPVQASATTALETLLQNHIQSASTDVIFEQWIEQILSHVNDDAVDSSVLNILENLLVLALKLNSDLVDRILPRIQSSRAQTRNLLVCVSALRRAGGLQRVEGDGGEEEGCWKGVLSYELLELAAVDCSEQNRILCISLIVESPKSTEIFTKGELSLVLWFLKFNINAQQPHFRQLMLSILKRFIKRLETSYIALIRENDPTDDNHKSQYYLTFIDELEQLCYDSLLPGANYSRRYVALQLLVWTSGLSLQGYVRNWQHHQIETLLYHLGDSYENNKALALELLCHCPVDMLKSKKYSTSLDLQDIIAEASSVKPTDCVTAVYKLKLLRSALPEYILPGPDCDTPSKVSLALLGALLGALEAQLAPCERGLEWTARRAPLYGVLHCAAGCAAGAAPGDIQDAWTHYARRVLHACVRVCACVRDVLTCAAPEGHLPTSGHMGNIPLEDGQEVTAQMVLLCAWRSIKEVSQILSTLVTQALTHEEFKPASFRSSLVLQVGEMFTNLLTETKHRGAFEQVYVGFTRMLTSLWRSRNPEFNSLPKLWLEELLAAIESGDPEQKLCATRRSAGLPFMIQALVMTELQVRGNPANFDACVARLLRLAGGGRGARGLRTRCHALHVLRALLRDRGLGARAPPAAPAALLLALQGFERRTWLERNSATLLFSALMVRIFGVQRNRDSENLCVRNRMTGRIFFLKYPKLYDFMLEKLKEVHDDNEEKLLRPSLYPILLLLARLYPSSLEGTVSNLKLTAFVPLVRACARSAVLTTRRLAARAVPALVEPERYIPHIEEMFELLSDRNIKRNYCHGILLQLIKLLEAKPDKLTIDKSQTRLLQLVKQSSWILRQSVGGLTCYPIADEYIKMINILIWRFDVLLEDDFINKVQIDINELIFKETGSKNAINPGREMCLANAAYLRLIISYRYEKNNDIRQFVYKCLAHECYEVTLTVLDYLLILHGVFEVENSLQEHLSEICNGLEMFENDPTYANNLCRILKTSKYLECTQKCLKLLTLKRDSAKIIIQAKIDRDEDISDDFVVDKLLYYIDTEHENLMHFYLGNLCNFLCAKMAAGDVNESKLVEAMSVIFSCSLPHNNDETRTVVVAFLENTLKMVPSLLDIDFKSLSEEDQFAVRCAWWGSAAVALHDDAEALRARAAAALAARRGRAVSLAPHCARAELRAGGDARRLAALALLDWRAEVCAADARDAQCRVFDQNEKYNTYLEETIWARDCARKIKEICDEKDLCEHIHELINEKKYRGIFERLCGDNLIMFERSIRGFEEEIKPKVKIFIDTLKNT